MIKKISLLLFIFPLSLLSIAQFQLPNNTNALTQYGNVAFTGTSETTRLNYGHFNSPALSINSFNSYLGVDTHIDALHGGLGVSAQYNAFEDIVRYKEIGLNYAYQHNIFNDLTLSVGIGQNYGQRTIRFSNIDTIVGKIQMGTTRVGALVYNDRLFAGGQFYYGRDKSEGNTFESTTIKLMGGYSFLPFSNKNLAINTNLNYFATKYYHLATLQAIFSTPRFSAGTSFTFNERLSILAGVNFWLLEIKAGYNILFSPLTNFYSSNAEISVEFNLPKSLKRRSNTFEMNLY